jgi:hypothetical protein
MNLRNEIGYLVGRDTIVGDMRRDDVGGETQNLVVQFFGHGAMLLWQSSAGFAVRAGDARVSTAFVCQSKSLPMKYLEKLM